MSMDEEPPDAAPPIDPRELGVTRLTLDRIRTGGLEGAMIDDQARREEAAEHGAEDDSPLDYLDTPYLREMEARSPSRARWARHWRPVFIAALSSAPFPWVACKMACVDPKTAIAHRQKDAIFEQACTQAEAAGAALLLASAWSSAVDGNIEKVYCQGVVVGNVRKYSDRMRALLLPALFPGMFRQPGGTTVNVRTGGGSGGGDEEMSILDRAHEICSKMTPLMMARQAAQIQGVQPPPIPMVNGFIRLADVPLSPGEKPV